MDAGDAPPSTGHLAPPRPLPARADDYDDLENYSPSAGRLEQNGNRQSPAAPVAVVDQLNTPLPSDLRSEPLGSATIDAGGEGSSVLLATPSRRQRYHRCDSDSSLRPYRIISNTASEQLLLWQAARALKLGLSANECERRPALRAKLKKVLAPTGSTNCSSGAAAVTAAGGSSGGKPRRASLSSTIAAKNKVPLSDLTVGAATAAASNNMPMDAGKVKAFRSLSFENKAKRASSSPEQDHDENQRLSFISTSTGYRWVVFIDQLYVRRFPFTFNQFLSKFTATAFAFTKFLPMSLFASVLRVFHYETLQ